MADPLWRLTLDNPYSFRTENGLCYDTDPTRMRPTPGNLQGCVQDPLTGLIMLQPSFLSNQYGNDMLPLSAFNVVPGYWQAVKRSQDQTNMYSMIKPQGGTFPAIEITIATAIQAVDADISLKDNIVWVAQSNIMLARDQGFVLHHNALNDQMIRKNNWFALSWDDFYIHCSQQGIMRVWKADDPNDLGGSWMQKDQFIIASPGDLIGRDGYFWFIPCPQYGLLVYHSSMPQKSGLAQLAAPGGGGGALKGGHIVSRRSHYDTDGYAYLFNASPLSIAVNPYQQMVTGVQTISYPASGTFLDDLYDIGYIPTQSPSTEYNTTATGKGTITVAVQKADNSGAWAADGSVLSKQARNLLTLATSDSRYTPFLYSHGAIWPPVFNTRDTTPIVLYGYGSNLGGSLDGRVVKLEYTYDEQYRVDGTATLILDSEPAKDIADRGDSTWLIEYSTDAGGNWTILNGGLTRDWHNEPVLDSGLDYYHSTCALHDMWSHADEFYETRANFLSGFDSLTVADSFNRYMQANGFPPVNPSFMPATAYNVNVPAVQQGAGAAKGFRYAPKEGDSAAQVYNKLLMFLRTQGVEYIMQWSWIQSTWMILQKPYDPTNIWILGPTASYYAPGSQSGYVSPDNPTKPQNMPEPPEGNYITCVGSTQSDTLASGVHIQAFINPSWNDPTSKDFSGRVIPLKRYFPTISDPNDLAIAQRRVYDASAHWRDKGSRGLPYAEFGLSTNQRVQILNNIGSIVHDAWVKSITYVFEDNRSTTSLQYDTVWESELKD